MNFDLFNIGEFGIVGILPIHVFHPFDVGTLGTNIIISYNTFYIVSSNSIILLFKQYNVLLCNSLFCIMIHTTYLHITLQRVH